MKNKRNLLLSLSSLILLASCGHDKASDPVVSQKFVHKYGYAVSKEEWDSRNYPGQVVSTLRDGVTVSASYENGVLHGPTTYTFPHSQTVQSYYLYNQGNLVKEIIYDIRGMPQKERTQLSASRYTLTTWYEDGSPLAVEEYNRDELIEGQYMNLSNEAEAWVEKGYGKRVLRDQKGTLLAIESIDQGHIARRETYYPNGSPETVSYYKNDQLTGEVRKFTNTGEPLCIEEWVSGELHGKSTYFKNGSKYLEVSYLSGKKNGIEVHFVDGELVSQEITWENDKRHGPTHYYINDDVRTEWYYNGKIVSKSRFDEEFRLDQIASSVSDEVRSSMR